MLRQQGSTRRRIPQKGVGTSFDDQPRPLVLDRQSPRRGIGRVELLRRLRAVRVGEDDRHECGHAQATFPVGLAPREDLVSVDVVQARQARHGGAWLQGLLDDGALEFERVAAVRAAWRAMRVLIQLCVHQSIVGTTLGAPSQGNRQLWRGRREDGVERTLTIKMTIL